MNSKLLMSSSESTVMKTYAYAIILTALYLASCKQPATTESVNNKDSVAAFDISSVKSTISENDKKFGDAVVKGDSAAVVALYASDAQMFPANQPAIETYDGIKKFFGEFARMRVKEFKLETGDVYGNGENVIEEGKYEMGDGEGKMIDQGKFIEIYRKENGEWKIYRDIFNSDLPLPTSARKTKK